MNCCNSCKKSSHGYLLYTWRSIYARRSRLFLSLPQLCVSFDIKLVVIRLTHCEHNRLKIVVNIISFFNGRILFWTLFIFIQFYCGCSNACIVVIFLYLAIWTSFLVFLYKCWSCKQANNCISHKPVIRWTPFQAIIRSFPTH
jgi:hypothetical protein